MKTRRFPTEEELDAAVVAGHNNILSIRAKGPDPNSALRWFAALEWTGGFNLPRTEMVEFDQELLWPMLDGNEPVYPRAEILAACERIGYPVFLRTDLASAKHTGPKAYKVETGEDLLRCVHLTFEDNACKDLASFARVFMLREFLDLPSPFVAFGGLPIAREWRFFASQEGALCEHFYWPEEAFERGFGVPHDWREKLSTISIDCPNLYAEAARAARAQAEGAWSVDFAQDAAGKWWLIDMARAESSWHPKHEPKQQNGLP